MKKSIQIAVVCLAIIAGFFFYTGANAAELDKPQGFSVSSEQELTIDSVGIQIKLENAPYDDMSVSQESVDKPGIGALMDYGEGTWLIADHGYQNFIVLPEVTEGMTAKVSDGIFTRNLKCVKTSLGKYTYDKDGGRKLVDIATGKQAITRTKGQVIIYTCITSDEADAFISYWV